MRATVKEPSVFESFKFYCSLKCYINNLIICLFSADICVCICGHGT